MGYLRYTMVALLLLTGGCSPTPDITTDVGIIDGGPRRGLAVSSLQQEATAALLDGMRQTNASGGAVVILEASTGRIRSLASVAGRGPQEASSAAYNRAVNSVHELGRVMAIFPIAQALDDGLIAANTMIETPPSLQMGRFRIRDFRPRQSAMTPAEVFRYASNVGTANIALRIGPDRQKAFLERLGLLSPNTIEQKYPTGVQSLAPANWTELSGAVVSYGYGLTASPLQVAAAYASVVNGGIQVTPTFGRIPQRGVRVVSAQTSAEIRSILRGYVSDGIGFAADVAGYSVGGASGTSDMLSPEGGYDQDKVVATFVAVLPADAPRYVIVTLLEDPRNSIDGSDQKTAGSTVIPLGAEIIERVGPLLFVH